jgi:hypothetical protein
MSVPSFHILEELSAQHDANVKARDALAATHGDRSSGSSNTTHVSSNDGSSGSSVPRANRSNNNGDRARGQRPIVGGRVSGARSVDHHVWG